MRNVGLIRAFVLIQCASDFTIRINGTETLSLYAGRYQIETTKIKSLEVTDSEDVSIQFSSVSIGFLTSIDGLPVNIVGTVPVSIAQDLRRRVAVHRVALASGASSLPIFTGFTGLFDLAGGESTDGIMTAFQAWLWANGRQTSNVLYRTLNGVFRGTVKIASNIFFDNSSTDVIELTVGVDYIKVDINVMSSAGVKDQSVYTATAVNGVWTIPNTIEIVEIYGVFIV